MINKIKYEFFIKGKNNHCEDIISKTNTDFILVDGATDKLNRKFNQKTPGQIIASLVANTSLSCRENGENLVKLLNKEVANLYSKFNINTNNKYELLACSFVLVRFDDDFTHFTQVGDVYFRINEGKIIGRTKVIDIVNSKNRAKHYMTNGNLQEARLIIEKNMEKQTLLQNNSCHKFGYGVIDGTNTPIEHITYLRVPTFNINQVEIFSDGYFYVPRKSGVKYWEMRYSQEFKRDPLKINVYPNTKIVDDRSYLLISKIND